jgi:hypothetical protein
VHARVVDDEGVALGDEVEGADEVVEGGGVERGPHGQEAAARQVAAHGHHQVRHAAIAPEDLADVAAALGRGLEPLLAGVVPAGQLEGPA